MNELRNDEQFNAANLVNRQPSVVSISEAEMAEDDTSLAIDRATSLDARDTQQGTHLVAPREVAQPNPLFLRDEFESFRSRWSDAQTSFVDEPRKAVELADSLVANVIQRIAEQFAAERADLEMQWDRGDEVDTEDLRLAFKRYRAFVDRLLEF